MSVYLDLKKENRNKVYNKIREAQSISSSALTYELQLSRPTIKQNLDELMADGHIHENGSFSHTGGRRAKAYSIVEKSKIAIGIDLTLNHLTIIAVDLFGSIIYEKRMNYTFSRTDDYLKLLGAAVEEAVKNQQLMADAILGVGIALPGLVTENRDCIFYGKILNFTGMTVNEFGKYIPYKCYLFNDADAAGYAEKSINTKLKDAFYVSLGNNIGGAFWLSDKVYRGEVSTAGEVGHMTIIPSGRLCYCGKRGCFETYCNARILADNCDGNLALFFERLKEDYENYNAIWNEYLYHLSIAVNNVRMLFGYKVILGGYVGAYLDDSFDQLKEIATSRNPFEDTADYLEVAKVKREALALGSALPFIHDFWRNV